MLRVVLSTWNSHTRSSADLGRHRARGRGGDRSVRANVYHLARAWRSIYVVTIVLTVYFNVFVAVTQAFLKVSFLHALAPTGKEPPFLVAHRYAGPVRGDRHNGA
jgi:hypothetical protein